MRCSISEMAKLSGVSVRTLHYYDEIGLLAPSEVVSETGYRYYDEKALEKLQQILFYRELDFALKDIVCIMNTSGYDKNEALKKQYELLKLKRKRLDRLIGLLSSNLKGGNIMSFKEFDSSEIEKAKEEYAKEAQERWGNTKEYAQYKDKASSKGDKEWNDMMKQFDVIMKKFSEHIGEQPESDEVQQLVGEWKAFINDNYYECTDEILAGLGAMYIADDRFKNNMDRHGEGTAQLISDAIAAYVS